MQQTLLFLLEKGEKHCLLVFQKNSNKHLFFNFLKSNELYYIIAIFNNQRCILYTMFFKYNFIKDFFLFYKKYIMKKLAFLHFFNQFIKNYSLNYTIYTPGNKPCYLKATSPSHPQSRWQHSASA